MTISDKSFENYFPEKKVGPPATKSENRLPFDNLEPKDFEFFCCELVAKLMTVDPQSKVDQIMPIGEAGQKQLGADIFAKEIFEGELIFTLYEVKRVKDYSKTDFVETLNRFTNNYEEWQISPKRFFLFVSRNVSAENISEWESIAGRKLAEGIEFRIIPPGEINSLVKKFPELVYKYFHKAWIEIFWGERGLWHLENYGIFNFEESTRWDNYEGIDEWEFEGTYSRINDHVFLHAFLPSFKENNCSCSIELRNGRFSHVHLTISHNQLINTYFNEINAPIDERTSFLFKDEEGVFCQIGNCMVKVSKNEASSICDVFDKLFENYSNKVLEIESLWRIREFEASRDFASDVPLIKIKRSLWSLLLEYANAHTIQDGNAPQNLFMFNRHIVQVYSSRENENMDVGFHAIIKPALTERFLYNYRVPDNEVVVVWQAPSRSYVADVEKVGPRFYWDALTTYEWLNTEMIPNALSWWNSKSLKDNFWKRLFRAPRTIFILQEYEPKDYILKDYHLNNSENTVTTVGQLKELSCDLQSFFHTAKNKIFLEQVCYKKLCLVLLKILEHSEFDDFRYVYGNMNYLKAENMSEFISAVKEHAETNATGWGNNFRIDCILRNIQVILRDGKVHLNDYEASQLSNDLECLIKPMHDVQMLLRQKERIN